jgi:hypothetical protein
MSKIGIGVNKKLLELFNMMKDGSLILKPYFQRNLVWNDKHKSNFIETILLDLPFPEIYLADGDIDLVSQTSKTLVVDGQQRMNTIYQYVTGSSDFKVQGIRRFAELTDTEKTMFYDYKIVARDLGRIDDDKLINIFQRINSVQYALNAMEINNALYRGEFITTARDILENNEFFRQVDIFSESEYSRMKDIEFILLIMSTIEEGGYFSSGKEIGTYVQKFDEDYPNKQEMLNNINTAFSLIEKCNFQPDSLWMKKSNFFVLVVELIKLLRSMKRRPAVADIKTALLELENTLYANKDKNRKTNRYAEYYYYIHQGIGSRLGRYKRGLLLAEHLDTVRNHVTTPVASKKKAVSKKTKPHS